jgi:hypothetical protein
MRPQFIPTRTLLLGLVFRSLSLWEREQGTGVGFRSEKTYPGAAPPGGGYMGGGATSGMSMARGTKAVEVGRPVQEDAWFKQIFPK